MMTINELKALEKCRDIELLCGDIYSYFAEVFSEDREIQLLWRKTAVEEQNHADQFALAIKLRRGISCQVILDAAQADYKISQLQKYLSMIRISPPSLIEALESALKLEESITKFHLENIVLFEDPGLRKMFVAIKASDDRHIESLQVACEKVRSRMNSAPGPQ